MMLTTPCMNVKSSRPFTTIPPYDSEKTFSIFFSEGSSAPVLPEMLARPAAGERIFGMATLTNCAYYLPARAICQCRRSVNPSLTSQNPRSGLGPARPHGGVHHQGCRWWLLLHPKRVCAGGIWSVLHHGWPLHRHHWHYRLGLHRSLSQFSRALKPITLIENLKTRSISESLIILFWVSCVCSIQLSSPCSTRSPTPCGT